MHVTTLFAAVLAVTISSSPAPPPGEQSLAAAVNAFRTRLQAELKEGMARGPEHAVTVCRERAPRIAEESGSEVLTLGRASERLRNPANAPRPWLTPILERWATHPGERLPRTVPLPGGRVGYVEPIVVQPLCLVCHGEAIAPAVSERLKQLYPQDRATGYRSGDFRGVFWAESGPAAD